jgi:hypothetical protein
MKHLILLSISLLLFSFSSNATTTVATDTKAAPLTLEQIAYKAGQEVAEGTVVPHEINNIRDRRILMGKPGLQLYVVFLLKSGQPVDYFMTDGKCVSSNKRLTPTKELFRAGKANDLVVDSASYDGTHGSSDKYVYCRTSDGGYKQWNGRIYVSDAPIELTKKAIILDLKG